MCPQSPGLLTKIIATTVRPRKRSRAAKRGAALVSAMRHVRTDRNWWIPRLGRQEFPPPATRFGDALRALWTFFTSGSRCSTIGEWDSPRNRRFLPGLPFLLSIVFLLLSGCISVPSDLHVVPPDDALARRVAKLARDSGARVGV